MSTITFIERLLKYKLLILMALIGAAYLIGQPTASALQPSPGKILNGAKYALAKPSVSVVASDPAAAEAGLDAASFTITRSGDTSAPLQVEYVVAGTAKASNDYIPLAGSVKIPAGAASTTFALTPIDDAAVEGAETVVVTLKAQTAYQVIAPSSATATIADDDAASQIVRFYVDDPSAGEAGPDTGRFTIARDGSTDAPLTVYYIVSGTATPGADYPAPAGSVTIPAGQSSVAIDLTPIDDRIVEQTEIVVLALSAHSSYSIYTPASATVTITDNDGTPSPSPAPSGYQMYIPVVVRGS